MIIRNSKPEDIKSLVKVEESSGYHKTKIDFLPWITSVFEDKNERIFVLEEKSEIIGYVTLRSEKRIGEIGLLAITKNSQGKGYGKLLLQHILKYAKEINCKRVFLEVRVDNSKAINLYQKFDFKKTKEYDKKIDNKTIRKMIMEKILK
jgi:[ribosomal protein S18]-alanine N-acetyltransferase